MKTSKLLIITAFLVISTALISQNNALDFDGTDDYINVSGLSSWNTIDAFTVEAWIYTDVGGNDMKIVGKTNGDHSDGFSMDVITNKLYLELWLGNTSRTSVTSTATFNNSEWTHLAMTWINGGNLKGYINGDLVIDVTPGTSYTISNSSSLKIGVAPWDASSYFFNGKVDEVRVWDDVRTESEIRTNMYSELAGTEVNLVAYYQLNEISETTANDAQTSGTYDGTLNGGFNFADNTLPSPAFFGPKNCLAFDGDNDYVSIPNLSFSNATAITIEGWIYPRSFNPYVPDFNISNIAGYDDASALVRIGDATINNNELQFILTGNQRLNSSIGLSINKWYHFAAVYDGATMSLYIDGILDVSLSTSVTFTTAGNFILGAGSGGRYLDGSMDEIRIWDDARTEAEIRENMCSTLTGNEANLVGYYNLDNGSGTTVTNIAGTSASDGTITNASWTTSSAFNTWLNTNTTTWATGANWSDGAAPTSTDNVGIPNFTNDPVSTGTFDCNNLVIGNNATLAFNSSGSHTIHGSAFVIGTSDINSGNLLTVTGSLYILPLSTLNVKVGGELTVGNKLDIMALGNCKLYSSAIGTGSLITNGTVSGNINIERYLNAWSDNHGWHFLSSPVSSQTIQPEFVSTPPVSSEDFYKWDEVNDIWINTKVAETGAWNTGFGDAMVVGEGYLVAYQTNQTKTFSGILNYATVEITGLTNTVTNLSHRGWNLIGNPFPSALSWDETFEGGWNLASVDGTAKIWNETNASYTDIARSGVIPAMQGFMVKVANDKTGRLNIYAGDRIHSPSTWYKNNETNTIKLTAFDTEGNTAQEAIIRIIQDATTTYDSKYDCEFLPGYAPSFYSSTSSGNLSTLALPEITVETTIPFSFIKNASSFFHIEVEGINNLEPQETVYLTDLKTNHTQLLNDNPVYSFTSEEGDVAERFVIHFSPLGIEDFELAEQIVVYATNGNIEFRSNAPMDANINIYTIAGQLINIASLNNESKTTISGNQYRGIAIVSIITKGGVVNKKVYLK